MPHSGIVAIDDPTLPARQHEVNNIKDYGFSGRTAIIINELRHGGPCNRFRTERHRAGLIYAILTQRFLECHTLLTHGYMDHCS